MLAMPGGVRVYSNADFLSARVSGFGRRLLLYLAISGMVPHLLAQPERKAFSFNLDAWKIAALWSDLEHWLAAGGASRTFTPSGFNCNSGKG